MKKYIGFIYETTNNISGKKYIGSHIGPESDIYFGSGVQLQQDLKKFGTNNFTRRTLEKVESIEQLSIAETKWLFSVNAKDNSIYYNRTNVAGVTYKKPIPQPDRNICPVCKERPVAINYTSNGKTRYRKVCDSCNRKGKKIKPVAPDWFKAGYRKKHVCEKCGYKAKYPEKQMSVFHVDGNLKNTSSLNLKTVCLNCRVELAHSKLPWKESPITPDF